MDDTKDDVSCFSIMAASEQEKDRKIAALEAQLRKLQQQLTDANVAGQTGLQPSQSWSQQPNSQLESQQPSPHCPQPSPQPRPQQPGPELQLQLQQQQNEPAIKRPPRWQRAGRNRRGRRGGPSGSGQKEHFFKYYFNFALRK
ncbi:alpha/beta-gliadin A-II isoform X1 [Monomorium pharaonis]|uniref:alpha/beta-gliadin A-II isoform X1 n=1 Tax=Monomorium pharaonis TaxID=307658 RepID=UPI00102E104A|nr:alpha/beta-gliadin A-II isoform X1 [Monomorium pharaonis]